MTSLTENRIIILPDDFFIICSDAFVVREEGELSNLLAAIRNPVWSFPSKEKDIPILVDFCFFKIRVASPGICCGVRNSYNFEVGRISFQSLFSYHDRLVHVTLFKM